MIKKFNEMYNSSSSPVERLDEILSVDDKSQIKDLIIEEIQKAYNAGFDYAWTQGKIVHTTNVERRERETRLFDNEQKLRFEEYLSKGINDKSGRTL
jgi:hypothetical protein